MANRMAPDPRNLTPAEVVLVTFFLIVLSGVGLAVGFNMIPSEGHAGEAIYEQPTSP